jgi:pyruvate dehydrogenase E2 component (dihydrolipoamide acetyltransferase)
MAEFRMPSLGADMESGVLLEWLVHAGDAVTKGDIVAVVDTQKAAVEVECFTSGVVEQLLVEPGTRVAVGTPLAIITATGAEPAEPAVAAATPAPVTSPLIRQLVSRHHVDLAGVQGTGVGGRITRADVEHVAARRSAAAPAPATVPRLKASPLARRLAGELGVALAEVRGSGPDGAIGVEDVQRAAAELRTGPAVAAPESHPAAAPAAAEAVAAGVERTKAMRAAIAALMARSKREIPHYYLVETVDLGPAMQWLRALNRTLPVPARLVPAVMLLKAAARAAATVPELNGFFLDGRFVPGEAVHLGVAVSLRGGGLVAPAIHHADRLDLAGLMAALRDLVQRTRAGRLRRTEMSDPTITVSNLGDQGVESIFGVIYPPQVALVGFGKIVDRPWAVDGLLGVRPTVTVSLAADHRVTDGVTGARFLSTLAQLLQAPGEL